MKRLLTTLIFCITSVLTFAQPSFSKTEKIEIFCKVWGFLKYYHPAVATGEKDWDKEFITKIDSAYLLNTKQTISDFYSRWISGLGEVKSCKKCNDDIADSLKFNFEISWLKDSTLFTNELINQLQHIVQNRNQATNYYVQQAKIAGNTTYENEKPYADSVFPSAPLRLLALSRYWNIINYFYPYKYVTGHNWDSVLTAMIPKFMSAKDTVAYHLTMLELTATINDSHAGFVSKYTNNYFGYKWAPFNFKIIDNKAIVTGFYNESFCLQDDVQIGDVFIRVGNATIEEIIKQKLKYIGASNEAAQLRNFFYAVFNGNTDTVTVAFERNGVIKQKLLHRYFFKDFNYKQEGNDSSVYKILKGNIGYVNLGLLAPNQVNKTLDKLKNTIAIIFDIRNYPDYNTIFKVCDFLNPEPKPFAKFTKPDITYPGIFHYTSPAMCGRTNKDFYKGKVVLLVNETTQSRAEFSAMALQTAPDVLTVGSQTAGADGDISLITFPGNYKTYMSGIGVYYPDGRVTQRVGIIPNIQVQQTIEGIRQHKDEVLQKAIEIISEKKNGL